MKIIKTANYKKIIKIAERHSIANLNENDIEVLLRYKHIPAIGELLNGSIGEGIRVGPPYESMEFIQRDKSLIINAMNALLKLREESGMPDVEQLEQIRSKLMEVSKYIVRQSRSGSYTPESEEEADLGDYIIDQDYNQKDFWGA